MTAERMKSVITGSLRLAAVLAAFALAACGSTITDEDLASLDEPAQGETVSDDVDLERDYVLGHNDVVQVRVFGQEELTGEYRIDANGRISMPLLGSITAGGKTSNELAREIRSQLQAGYLRDPQVTTQVVKYRPFYIVGGVKTPGSYEYMAGMNVLQAIAMAGGYSEDALDRKPVVVTRGGTGGGQRGLATPTTRVFPGDTIEVPKRRILRLP